MKFEHTCRCRTEWPSAGDEGVSTAAIVLLLVWVEMATMACHNEVNKLLGTIDETVYELLANPLGIPPSQVQILNPQKRLDDATRR